ncbi:MAG: glycoside hydrolase [Flavobacteriaceae bacterium]|nr:glycoside hydrolase [Flavobacteriaceae bacterium]
MQHLLGAATGVLENNWKGTFTIPCEGLYPFQWNWDSGFIAIGWGHVKRERAYREIHSLLRGQWKNGFIPHIVFHNKADSYYPGPEVHASNLHDCSPDIPTSGITQPPVLGFVLEYLGEMARFDEAYMQFLEKIYDRIYQNIEYFYLNRDPQKEGLVYICHNWEAGTDNTPVWDFIWETFEVPEYRLNRKDTKLIDADHRPTNREYHYYIHLIELFKSWRYDDKLIAERSPFLVQDPLFNALLLRSAEGMINLGKRLGKTEMVSKLKSWYQNGSESFNLKLYDKELKAYVYYDLRNDRQLRHMSSSSFTPLFAGIPDKIKATELISHLDHGRFSGMNNENYLCASFDPASPYFNSKKYWRGPIWINLNWLIHEGLKRYGFTELAERLRSDTLNLIEKYGFYEYFEPSKALNKELTEAYGGKNFSWSAALTIDLLSQK